VLIALLVAFALAASGAIGAAVGTVV